MTGSAVSGGAGVSAAAQGDPATAAAAAAAATAAAIRARFMGRSFRPKGCVRRKDGPSHGPARPFQFTPKQKTTPAVIPPKNPAVRRRRAAARILQGYPHYYDECAFTRFVLYVFRPPLAPRSEGNRSKIRIH
jgi:hypothetical protein